MWVVQGKPVEAANAKPCRNAARVPGRARAPATAEMSTVMVMTT